MLGVGPKRQALIEQAPRLRLWEQCPCLHCIRSTGLLEPRGYCVPAEVCWRPGRIFWRARHWGSILRAPSVCTCEGQHTQRWRRAAGTCIREDSEMLFLCLRHTSLPCCHQGQADAVRADPGYGWHASQPRTAQLLPSSVWQLCDASDWRTRLSIPLQRWHRRGPLRMSPPNPSPGAPAQ